jgi:hypothetical protein
VKKIQDKMKFDKEDILCIVHITDTDGCFIGDEFITIDESQKNLTMYNEENIVVNSEKQKGNISQRNMAKRNNTNVMYPKTSIIYDRIGVNYQLFYFARHVEHVIFNEPSRNKKAKVSEVSGFLEGLEGNLEEWLLSYLPELSGSDYVSKYKSSWEYIISETNSLKRGTSVPLLFDYIKKIIKE